MSSPSDISEKGLEALIVADVVPRKLDVRPATLHLLAEPEEVLLDGKPAT